MSPSPQLLFGPLLCGAFFNSILYGICALQSFCYWRTFYRDKRGIRFFVLYLFILETMNAAFNISMIYELLVLGFDNPSTLIVAPKMLVTNPLMTSLISISAQLFTAWRIKIISGSWVLPIIIVSLGLMSWGGGITLACKLAVDRRFEAFGNYRAPIITWLGASAVADILITITLYWFLSRRRTGIKATDDNISRIVKLTVHTGLLSATLAISDLVVAVAVPNTTINFIWDLMISQMYAIALLSTLNARPSNPTESMVDDNVLFADREIDSMGMQSVNRRFSAAPRGGLEAGPDTTPPWKPQHFDNTKMGIQILVDRHVTSPTAFKEDYP